MIDKNTQALKQAEMNPQEEKQVLEQAPIEKAIYVKLPTGGYKPFMYEFKLSKGGHFPPP
jgi:hypothetical protein